MHEKPVAVCTNCGHFIYGQAPFGGPCGLYLADRKRCRGTNRSALNSTDWAQCTYCVDGRREGERCGVCQGSGWQYVRK